jgi:hypothetical protein
VTVHDEYDKWLRGEKLREQQESLRLLRTRRCAEMVHNARKNGWGVAVAAESFKLMECMARIEWGPGTVIDDFSDENHYVVTQGRKRALIPREPEEKSPEIKK